MNGLLQHDVIGNCRAAFDASEMLGIPRVIEPSDMSLLAVPDKLAVMTYLYQLRSHFTGHQLQIEQIGNTSDETSYVIGSKRDQDIFTFDDLKKQLSQQNILDEANKVNEEKLSLEKKDVKNMFLTGSKHILGKVLSPNKDKNLTSLKTMTNQQNTEEKLDAATETKDNVVVTNREPSNLHISDNEVEWQQSVIKRSQNKSSYNESKRNLNDENKLESPNSSNLDTATTNVRMTEIKISVVVF